MLKPFLLPVLIAAAAASDPHPAALVGVYDGHQMEMGAGLELGRDGRFRYGLAYGALDEEAAGTWVVEQDHVVLRSDPVTPPRFVLAGQKQGEAGTLHITLEMPQGMSPQYFEVTVESAHGRSSGAQLTEDGATMSFVAGDPPVRARLILPVFALQGDFVPIDPAKGYWLAFRFEPNDLGKVDFRATPLRIDHGDLILVRHDREIRFRRAAAR